MSIIKKEQNPLYKLGEAERLEILRMLYPEYWFDMLNYKSLDYCVEMDKIGIPKYKGDKFYLITSNEELLSILKKTVKEYFEEKYKNKDNEDNKESI